MFWNYIYIYIYILYSKLFIYNIKLPKESNYIIFNSYKNFEIMNEKQSGSTKIVLNHLSFLKFWLSILILISIKSYLQKTISRLKFTSPIWNKVSYFPKMSYKFLVFIIFFLKCLNIIRNLLISGLG